MDQSMLLYWKLYAECVTTDQIVQEAFNPVREFSEDLIDGAIVDIGCGQSNFLIEYSKSGRQLVGIDNDNYQLESLMKRVLEYNSGQTHTLNLLHQSFPDTDLPDLAYSLIILSNFLHFFSLPEAADIITKVKAHTKKGTIIFIRVHSDKYYYNDPENPGNNDYFKHYFTTLDLNKLFDANEFERIFIAEIQNVVSKSRRDVINRWADKMLDLNGVKNRKERQLAKDEYLKSEASIVAMYRRL